MRLQRIDPNQSLNQVQLPQKYDEMCRAIEGLHNIKGDDYINVNVVPNQGILITLKNGKDGGGSGSKKTVTFIAAFPCKIVSKEGAFYNVTKFEDGIDLPSTGSAKVYVLQLNFAETLPVDSWVIANSTQIGVTGGGNVIP